MRLEDLSTNNILMVSDQELKNFRERANQLYCSTRAWAKNIRKRMVGVSQPMEQDKLLEIYYLIVGEMRNRGLKNTESELDRKMFKRGVRGVDIGSLPAIVVKESVVSLSGDFVTSPKQASSVAVYLDANEFGDEGFTFDLEKRLVELLMDQTGKSVVVHRDGEGLSSPVISMFDLVLIPRDDTVTEQNVDDLRKRLETRSNNVQPNKGVLALSDDKNMVGASLQSPTLSYTDISKPYPTEHSAPQETGKYDDYARENNKFGQGIHAIWGIKGGKSKLASIRFDAKKFTVVQAKTWLKEHDYKTIVEASSGVKKSEPSFIKNEEARVVGGLIYTVGDTDSQNDFVDDPQEIFAAMKSWMLSGHRMKFMHDGDPVNTPLIECFQAEYETVKGGQVIPKGSWYISNYIPEDAEDLWKAIKDGRVGGYSMAGKSKAEVVEE